jgi:hypothetical protein
MASFQRSVPGGGTPMPFMAIFQPPLLGRHMFGGTGYPAWYNAHASFTVRLPRPKPFAVAILQEDEDDIAWNGEEKIWGGEKKVWER